MSKIIEIEVEQKLVGKLELDDYCESPDTWGDDNVFLVYDHRQFYVKRNGFEPEKIFEYLQLQKKFLQDNFKHIKSLADFKEWTEETDEYIQYRKLHEYYNDYFIFPTFAYVHSGVSLSLGSGSYPFNCQFDTSMSGFVLISKEETDDKNKARELAEGLVKTWNTYLEGDIWSMSIELQTVNIANDIVINIEHLDSCGGYYGIEHAKEDMINRINHYKKEYSDAIIKIIEPN